MSSREGVVKQPGAAQLGIGTAAFAPGYSLGGDAPSRSECARLLRDAISAGIRYLDTAPAYAEAENIIGDVADLVQSAGVRVCTKIASNVRDPRAMRDSLAGSLARLRLPSVDTVMIHNADERTIGERDVVAGLTALMTGALALKTGASTYGVDDAVRVAAEPWCSAIQIEHSIINPSVIEALGARSDDVEVVVRSVLCKGLLTDRRREARVISSGIAATLDALDRLSAEWGWPLAEMAIRFALDTPGVKIVLVGVISEAELETALRAAGRPSITREQRKMMSRFNRADSDATHPERWTSLAAT